MQHTPVKGQQSSWTWCSLSCKRRRILGILKEPEEKIHDSLTGKTMTFLSDEYASRTASSLAKNKQRRINLHDREAVEEEIIARAERNLKRANRRMDENYIEEVSDDEHFLDESNVQETAPVVKPSIPSFIADAVDFIGLFLLQCRLRLKRLLERAITALWIYVKRGWVTRGYEVYRILVKERYGSYKYPRYKHYGKYTRGRLRSTKVEYKYTAATLLLPNPIPEPQFECATWYMRESQQEVDRLKRAHRDDGDDADDEDEPTDKYGPGRSSLRMVDTVKAGESEQRPSDRDKTQCMQGCPRQTRALSAAFDIRRVLLNLARSKALTFLALSSLRKIHEDPACVKMKKGLVTDPNYARLQCWWCESQDLAGRPGMSAPRSFCGSGSEDD
ncbi:uncharacterized protein EDB93DRAFT_1109297 [Suillus bovinus]|uniref:uncharacterized protein n=1 Tax=Suillus bovinus TaxID=48563 RepID=UPI001B869C96|nr:uncharacterized protein EDB93DRAFT_1109297 [Suillus bovinus]KAG2127469.1 hypothetical protein EDB93DRAFT_1109297 [Suillus bovinus]